MSQKSDIAGLEKAVAAALKRLAELKQQNTKLEKHLALAREEVASVKATSAKAAASARAASKAVSAQLDLEPSADSADGGDSAQSNLQLRERLVEIESRLAALIEA